MSGALPSNAVSANGVGVVPDSLLNAFAQSSSTISQLRGFVGLSGMSVVLQGGAAPADGNGGLFYWATGSFTDDNLDTIVPYAAVGQGAWLRCPLDVSQPLVSVVSFGADPTGVANSTAAFTKANATSLSIYIPPGTYLLNGFAPLPGTTVQGSGQNATTIDVPASGTAFTIINVAEAEANLSINDITINGAGTNTTGLHAVLADHITMRSVAFTGLTLNAVFDRGRWHDVTLHCRSMGNASYKSGQIQFVSTVNGQYEFYASLGDYEVNCGQYDPGVVVGSSDPAVLMSNVVVGEIYNLRGDSMQEGGGAKLLVLEDACQGLTIIKPYCDSPTTGILIQQGTLTGASPLDCTIIDPQIDAFTDFGINHTGGSNNSIIGGQLTEGSNTSVAISMSAINCRISDVMMVGVGGSTVGTGIKLASCNGITVTGCTMDEYSIALDLTGGGVSNMLITGNNIQNVATPIAGSIAGLGNRVTGNVGVNTSAVSTPAIVSATPVPNNTGSDCMIYLIGGTISDAKLSLQDIGAFPGPYLLPATEFIELTYTGSPNWIWAGVG